MTNDTVMLLQKASDVIQLQKSQILEASTVAAKAFADDPVFTCAISDDREFRPGYHRKNSLISRLSY